MKKFFFITTLIVTLIIFISDIDGESVCSWVSYGGNIRHTFEMKNNCIPNEKMTILYVKEYDEKIVCHPVKFENSIYLVVEDGRLISQDADSGEIIWQQSGLSTRVEFAPFVNTHSVYQVSGNDLLKICREDGKIINSYTASSRITTPVLQQADGIFIGLRDGTFLCLDTDNLEIKWSFKADKSIVSTPSVCNGKVFLGSTDKRLYCIDNNNGNKLWSFVCENPISEPIAVSNDKLYVISGSSLYAFDIDGTPRWKYQTYADLTSVGVADNKVVCAATNFKVQCLDGNYSGDMCCIKPAKELWRSIIVKGRILLLNISDQQVLLSCELGDLVSIDTETGTTNWSVNLDYDLHNAIACSNRVFIADKKALVVLAQKPDKLIYKIGSNVYSRDKYSLAMDSKPEIRHSRTFLPARYVVEPLGGEIKWDQHSKQITINIGSMNIVLTVGKSVALVNGTEKQISEDVNVTPVIVNGRTLVPLRFIAESLGCEVGYISKTKEVMLTVR
jgi:outer membrane protein assembly factor BamB